MPGALGVGAGSAGVGEEGIAYGGDGAGEGRAEQAAEAVQELGLGALARPARQAELQGRGGGGIKGVGKGEDKGERDKRREGREKGQKGVEKREKRGRDMR